MRLSCSQAYRPVRKPAQAAGNILLMLEPVKRKNKCSILHLREQELSNGLKATVACRVDFNEQRMHRLIPHLSSSAQQLQWEKLPDVFSQQSPQGDVSSAHSGFRRSSDMQLQYP